MHCRVRNCRHSTTHTTREHRCGNCGGSGHGQMECDSLQRRETLRQYFNDTLPEDKQCTVPNCSMKEYHTNEAHYCSHCNERHSEQDCPTRVIELDCPICRKHNSVPNSQPKLFGLSDDNKCKVCLENPVQIFLPQCGHACLCSDCLNQMDETHNAVVHNYEHNVVAEPPSVRRLTVNDIVVYDRQNPITHTDVGFFEQSIRTAMPLLDQNNRKVILQQHAGMGCIWFFRQQNAQSSVEGFFMHSDNWGQYGPATDDRPKLDDFVRGYRDISS